MSRIEVPTSITHLRALECLDGSQSVLASLPGQHTGVHAGPSGLALTRWPRWCLQERQHCEHPTVIVGGFGEIKLPEDAGHVRLERLGAQEQLVRDRRVRPALGHQGKDVAFAGGQR
jgi:hypothetical protein